MNCPENSRIATAILIDIQNHIHHYLKRADKKRMSPENKQNQNVSFAELVEDYIKFLLEHKGLKKSTLNTHRRWILSLEFYMKENKIKTIRDLNILQLDKFIFLCCGKLQRGSIEGLTVVLRSFFRYLFLFILVIHLN